MTEKDKLLYRLLRKIQAQGYYHPIDVALLDWLLSSASVKEVSAKYEIRPQAFYKQKSRLARREAGA